MDQLITVCDFGAVDTTILNTWDHLLKALSDALAPNEGADAARAQIVQELLALLQQLDVNGQLQIMPYGLFVSGLHSPDSDLDMALVGRCQEAEGAPAVELCQQSAEYQKNIMYQLADLLESNGIAAGPVQRAVSARVRLLKFADSTTGIECDMIIGQRRDSLNDRLMGVMASIDDHCAQLCSLVKLWAKAHGLHDASCAMLNSLSLRLMVIFYLQQQEPAILPPFWTLLHSSKPDDSCPRVPQQAAEPGDAGLEGIVANARHQAQLFVQRRDAGGGQGRNDASLAQLLGGFFSFYAGPLKAWAAGKQRSQRICTYFGTWRTAPWPRPWCCSVEDPFDDTNNTAKSVGTSNSLEAPVHYIAYVFSHSVEVLEAAGMCCGSKGVPANQQKGCCSHQLAVHGGGHGLSATHDLAWLFGPAGMLALPEQVAAAELGIDAALQASLREWLDLGVEVIHQEQEGPAEEAGQLRPACSPEAANEARQLQQQLGPADQNQDLQQQEQGVVKSTPQQQGPATQAQKQQQQGPTIQPGEHAVQQLPAQGTSPAGETKQLQRPSPLVAQQRLVEVFRRLMAQVGAPDEVLCMEDWRQMKRAHRKEQLATHGSQARAQPKAHLP